MHVKMKCNGHHQAQARVCPHDSVSLTHGQALASDEVAGVRDKQVSAVIIRIPPRNDLSGSIHVCGVPPAIVAKSYKVEARAGESKSAELSLTHARCSAHVNWSWDQDL